MNLIVQIEEIMDMEAQELDIDYNLVRIGDKSLPDYIEIILKNKYMDKFKEVANTKQLRKDIDEVVQRVKGLDQSRETSRAIAALQEVIMWLDMNLKQLEEEDPYPESRNPDSQRIERTNDGLKF